jgi:predicted Zn-ribbon and HTH transcriptional regulator
MDPDAQVRIFKDGNMWCAVRDPFINLQESDAGFGEKEVDALQELKKAEMVTEHKRREGVRRFKCNNCGTVFDRINTMNQPACNRCKAGGQYVYEYKGT